MNKVEEGKREGRERGDMDRGLVEGRGGVERGVRRRRSVERGVLGVRGVVGVDDGTDVKAGGDGSAPVGSLFCDRVST
jgi:hypothetical protein